MSWWMGAGLGFLRGGPFGAVVGGAAEHFLGKKLQNNFQKSLPGIQKKGDYITSLVIILTRVGMVDDALTQKQVEIIHSFFRKNLDFGAADFKAIAPLIIEVQNKKPDLDRFIAMYKKSCQNNYNLLLIALCYQISLVVDKLDEETEKLIKQLVLLLGVSYDQHNAIRKKYSLGIVKTPYHVLKISSDATNEEVKKAYRNLIREYHPDRAAHEGKAATEVAHLKFLEIQQAYKELESVRGI